MNASQITPTSLVARTQPAANPRPSKRLLRLFGAYAEGYLRRHFHTVRLLQNGLPNECENLPLVIYLNHSSWWDPLVCLLLARRFFPERMNYAPIDAKALARYRFLSRLGFIGIEGGTRAGATHFLARADTIVASSENVLWITPQGKFVDAHARPVRFRSGLSHLAKRAARVAFLPLALEFSFWEERLPEVLLNFGPPLIFGANNHLRIAETTRLFESAMTNVQTELSAAAQRREPADWQILLKGRRGVGGVYDLWRGLRAKLRGENFHAAHSDL